MKALKTSWKEVQPSPAVLIDSMRNIGYSLPTAIADIIDNSISAGAKRIDILANTDPLNLAIGILDDGNGMTGHELVGAMQLGAISPSTHRDETDLGRFGFGLKTASFSQCRRLTVVSCKSNMMSSARWDLDLVEEQDTWVIEQPANCESLPWLDRLTGDGTLVVWQNLDRFINQRGRIDRKGLLVQLNDVASHIELVFHRYLSGRHDGPPKVQIFLNGRTLRPFDPFHSNHPATQNAPEEVLALKGKLIRIKSVTLPHPSKVSKSQWKYTGGPDGYSRNQGFYLYRNYRLIVHGTWFGLARHTESKKLCRIKIDIPNSMDSDWKLDVKKESASPPPTVRKRLRSIVGRLSLPSRRTFRNKRTNLTNDTQLPIWIRVQSRNHISYKIDSRHPVLSRFSSSLNGSHAITFRRLIALFSATLPIESIFTDMREHPDMVDITELEDSAFRNLAESTYLSLVDNDFDETTVRSMMKTSEPFRSRWRKVESYLDALTEKE